MRVLVVDVGGTHVKVLATGHKAPREFPSGPTLTAEQMVDGVKTVAAALNGLQADGLAQWRRDVEDVVARLIAALEPEDVVLGGGNAHQLETLPPGCRAGDNANAFVGGELLWKRSRVKHRTARAFTALAHSTET